MAELKVGDTVFLTEEAINYHEDLHARYGATWMLEFSKSRGSPLTIVAFPTRTTVALACRERSDWGINQYFKLHGIPINTWKISVDHIESRNGNTISLHELNRGL